MVLPRTYIDPRTRLFHRVEDVPHWLQQSSLASANYPLVVSEYYVLQDNVLSYLENVAQLYYVFELMQYWGMRDVPKKVYDLAATNPDLFHGAEWITLVDHYSLQFSHVFSAIEVITNTGTSDWSILLNTLRRETPTSIGAIQWATREDPSLPTHGAFRNILPIFDPRRR